MYYSYIIVRLLQGLLNVFLVGFYVIEDLFCF